MVYKLTLYLTIVMLLFQDDLQVNILPYYCYAVFRGALQENIYGCDAGSQDI